MMLSNALRQTAQLEETYDMAFTELHSLNAMLNSIVPALLMPVSSSKSVNAFEFLTTNQNAWLTPTNTHKEDAQQPELRRCLENHDEASGSEDADTTVHKMRIENVTESGRNTNVPIQMGLLESDEQAGLPSEATDTQVPAVSSCGLVQPQVAQPHSDLREQIVAREINVEPGGTGTEEQDVHNEAEENHDKPIDLEILGRDPPKNVSVEDRLMYQGEWVGWEFFGNSSFSVCWVCSEP
jgi:hypothetical protein